MLRHRVHRALRAVFALSIALTMFGSALGSPSSPASAATSPDPYARLQLVVKQVEILDDREGTFSGKGEMDFYISIWSCPEWAPAPCLSHRYHDPFQIASAYARITGGTGDILTMDRLVPRAGDTLTGQDVTEELGLPILPGYRYVIEFHMVEDDGANTSSEEMGKAYHLLGTADTGLTIGTHLGRPTGADGGHVGDYLVTYEIRRVALPDLRPSQIEVQDLPGSTKKRVCTGVQNVELADAGPFELAVRADGKDPQGGRTIAANMASGTGRLMCVEIDLPSSGEHTISATVDDRKRVTEFNEANNVIERKYEATGAGAR